MYQGLYVGAGYGIFYTTYIECMYMVEKSCYYDKSMLFVVYMLCCMYICTIFMVNNMRKTGEGVGTRGGRKLLLYLNILNVNFGKMMF